MYHAEHSLTDDPALTSPPNRQCSVIYPYSRALIVIGVILCCQAAEVYSFSADYHFELDRLPTTMQLCFDIFHTILESCHPRTWPATRDQMRL